MITRYADYGQTLTVNADPTQSLTPPAIRYDVGNSGTFAAQGIQTYIPVELYDTNDNIINSVMETLQIDITIQHVLQGTMPNSGTLQVTTRLSSPTANIDPIATDITNVDNNSTANTTIQVLGATNGFPMPAGGTFALSTVDYLVLNVEPKAV